MKSGNISVVIPTMNRLDTLKETIESYISGRVIPNQIVIVDQTENVTLREQIYAMIRQYRKITKVDYYYQKKPSSTKARNIGLKFCKNDIVIFSDDDVTVQNTTVGSVNELMLDDRIAMIAGINSRDGFSASQIGCIFGKKSYKRRNIGHVTSAMYGRFPEKKVVGTVCTEWAMGFFFVVRKSLIEKWNNYWDEKLTSYAYAEDLDFSYSYYKHAKAERMLCILSERIVVEHRVSTEWRVPTKKTSMMLVINREYLSYKHNMGWKSRCMTRWSNFGEFIVRVIKKANAKDIIIAQLTCDIHRKELKKGILKPQWYQ